ncbi:MAG: hypothetical protein LYZ70_00075 [Nitrososphaerales archaeon]|nr:hypothetical protein [Nitrososphaerales archaeon]
MTEEAQKIGAKIGKSKGSLTITPNRHGDIAGVEWGSRSLTVTRAGAR